MNINFYPGNCHTCNKFVDKREGFYNYGNVYCTETITISTPHSWDVCVPQYNHYNNTSFATIEQCLNNENDKATLINQERETSRELTRQQMVANGEVEALAQTAKVRSLTQVINKVLGCDIAIADMTFSQLIAVRDELQKRIDRKTSQANPKCVKCSGTGAFWKLAANNQYFDDGCWSCQGTGLKAKYR
jgi:hypothetical protein